MYCYKPHEIPPKVSIAFALEAELTELTVASGVSLCIKKYECEMQVWPSLADFCYATFPVIIAEDANVMHLWHVNRAASQIAVKTRRGRGNTIFTSPTTRFNFQNRNPYASFDYASNIGFMEGLDDTDVLIIYSGDPKIDGGFYWHPNPDGTVSTQSWDRSKDYGIIVRFP